jgi:cytosine/adenosine deaminase-related metal-dependent hydrolase
VYVRSGASNKWATESVKPGRSGEFGSLGVGKRADLLLLEGNPLQDVAQLRRVVGVMVRGKWLPRDQLHQMLAELVRKE